MSETKIRKIKVKEEKTVVVAGVTYGHPKIVVDDGGNPKVAKTIDKLLNMKNSPVELVQAEPSSEPSSEGKKTKGGS